MFELVFLGTSASAPSIHRGLSSVAVLAGEERFLVDCGEGTQRQILRSGIGFKRLNRILLTHPHLDHILGVGGLMSTYVRWEAIQDVHIWGSAQTLERMRSLIYDVVLLHQEPRIPIYLHEIHQAGEIYASKKFTVSTFPTIHRGRGCFGYIFQERNHRPFLSEIADSLGVPFGPERSRLVRGENITLADGREITPDMVLGEEVKGAKVVFTGDVAQTEHLRPHVQDADALVIEGTFVHNDLQMANSFGHITITQAAQLALECNVKGLLITHLSRRYGEREMIAEARSLYPKAFVVRDLDEYRVGRSVPLEKIEEPVQRDPDDGDMDF
jgi:ribonuclease Z